MWMDVAWQKDNSGSHQAHPYMTAGVFTKDCFLGNPFCSLATIIVPEGEEGMHQKNVFSSVDLLHPNARQRQLLAKIEEEDDNVLFPIWSSPLSSGRLDEKEANGGL
ncbi:hypothetical protein MUK42_06090 [Musa troglodytarum]|uniref:Uncharacterized protein n=1 Tax=Musa troglodytarum TaxID=320322 RepID=A0A9E7H072_9LILI|nr:hypothetical protein MUK42_06090 [Musa troglodytarum]URE22348.1 hypothetical protein MUK42_06090 [Musa troglodytarum]